MSALRLARLRYSHVAAGARLAAKATLAASLGLGALAVALRGAPAQGLLLAALAGAVGTTILRDVDELRRLCRLARLRRLVFGELRLLGQHGWRVRSPVRWPGARPLSHFLVSPDGGLAFALELAEAPTERELAAVQAAASWLALSGRPCIAVLAAGRVDAEQADACGVLLVGAGDVAGALAEAHRGYLEALSCNGSLPPAVLGLVDGDKVAAVSLASASPSALMQAERRNGGGA